MHIYIYMLSGEAIEKYLLNWRKIHFDNGLYVYIKKFVKIMGNKVFVELSICRMKIQKTTNHKPICTQNQNKYISDWSQWNHKFYFRSSIAMTKNVYNTDQNWTDTYCFVYNRRTNVKNSNFRSWPIPHITSLTIISSITSNYIYKRRSGDTSYFTYIVSSLRFQHDNATLLIKRI